jgi:hypothetical protein
MGSEIGKIGGQQFWWSIRRSARAPFFASTTQIGDRRLSRGVAGDALIKLILTKSCLNIQDIHIISH